LTFGEREIRFGREPSDRFAGIDLRPGGLSGCQPQDALRDLDETAMDDLRGSGLAHVISISGLHMSLVAGTVFWFLRWTLALFPSIALRYSVRALAGGAALVCVTIYLALSGASIAAVRSYLMIAVVFLAILLNRPALSL